MRQDRLLKNLDNGESQGADVMEIRAEETQHTSIRIRLSDVDIVSMNRVTGHSAHVLMDGVWGFAYSEGAMDVPQTIRNACKAATSFRSPRRVEEAKLADVKSINRKVALKSKLPLESIDIGEKAEFLRSLCSDVADADTRIKTCWADYSEITGCRELATSEVTLLISDAVSYRACHSAM